MRTVLAILLFAISASCSGPSTTHSDGSLTPFVWESLNSGEDVSLRGLSAVDKTTAWASGQNGTVLRTLDAGRTWMNVGVPGAEALDFRNLHAFDKETAIVLSAGAPAQMYKTKDAGATWREVYANNTPGVFFDAMDFWRDGRGLAFSDPIDGHLLIIKTEDQGKTWRHIDSSRIPPALDREAGFAASGTCLRVASEKLAWIGLGGPAARVFVSRDAGERWEAVDTPMSHSESAGIFSLAIGADGGGVGVGGDYTMPEAAVDSAIYTMDAGRTWALSGQPPQGYRSAVVVYGSEFIATGPNGTDISRDNGRTWQALAEGPGYHTIDIAQDGSVWAAGSDGRIGRASPRDQ